MNLAKRLQALVDKKHRRIIGLMSGMSMDGVNLACADIAGDFPDLKVTLVGSNYLPYSPEFQRHLKNCIQGSVKDISELNVRVSREFSQCVEIFLKENHIARESIDAIGSHGQTLFHSSTDRSNISTLQIGTPSVLAELTSILTVGNFRYRDIAAGGLGAPLVGLADYVLFRSTEPVALNNLGSISNVTVVTPKFENLLSFDTGPANMAIDYFARLIPQNTDGIDKDGALSCQGHVIDDLLVRLLGNRFFAQSPPRAAGFAEFGPEILSQISKPFLSAKAEDLVRTGVEFAALTLQTAYLQYVIPRYPQLKKIIFSGGGIHNRSLIRRIKELLPQMNIETLPKELADAKEALAFAILANETLCGRPGTIPAMTGVRKPTVLGEIAI